MADIVASVGIDGGAAIRGLDELIQRINKLTDSIELKVSADTSAAEAAVERVGQRASGLSDTLGRTGAAALKFTAITGAINQVAEALDGVLQVGVQYESTLAAVGAITGQSGAALDNLGAKARAIATDFGTSATSNLQAFQGILSKLGPQVADNADALESMARTVNTLSAASGDDANVSMNALVDTMLQLGLVTGDSEKDAAQMARTADALAASAKVGAAEIPQVAQSMLQAGVAAKDANQSLEKTTAAIQVLAVGGKVGSEAGVALRNVMGLIQKASGPAATAMARLGTSSQELGTILTTQGLDAALVKISAGMEKLNSDAERNATLMEIFGTENSAAAGILLANVDKFAEFEAGISSAVQLGSASADGAAAQAAARLSTSEALLNKIQARVNDTFISIQQSIGSAGTAVLQSITQIGPQVATLAGIKTIIPEGAFAKATQAFKNLGPTIASASSSVASTIAALASKIAPGLVAAGTTATATGGAFTTMWTAITGPVGLAVLAIGAVIAALVVAYNTIEPFADFVDGLVNTIIGTFQAFAPVFSELGSLLFEVGGLIFDLLIAPFQLLWSIGSTIFGALGELIGSFFATAESGEGALDGIKRAAEIIGQIISLVTASVAGYRAAISETVAIASEIADALLSLDFSKAAEIAGNAGKRVGGAFAKAATDSLDTSDIERAISKIGEIQEAQIQVRATVDKAAAIESVNNNLVEVESQIAALKVKTDLSGAEEKQLEQLTAKAQGYKNKLAEIVPEAVTSVATSVSATGEFVKTYDVATDKVKAFVEAQKASASADIQRGQAEYSKNVAGLAGLYQKQRANLEGLYKRADELAKSGDLVGSKKALEDAAKLREEYQTLGPQLQKAFEEGAQGGLLTEDAIKAVAKAQGITVEEAKKLVGLIKEQSQATQQQKDLLAEIAGEYERQSSAVAEEIAKRRTTLLDIRKQLRDNKELTAEQRKQLKAAEAAEIAEGRRAVAIKKSNEAVEESTDIALGLKERKAKTEKKSDDDSAKRALDLEKLRAEIARRQIIDENERKRADVRDAERFALAELAIEADKVRKAKDLSQKTRDAQLKSLTDKEALTREKFALDMAEVEGKIAAKAFADTERAFLASLDTRIDEARRREAEYAAVTGASAADETERLRLLSEARISIVQAEAEKKVAAFVNEQEAVKELQAQIAKALETGQTAVAATLQTQLLALREATRLDPRAKQIIADGARAEAEERIKAERAIEDARIKYIVDVSEREREVTLQQARLTYEARIKEARGNISEERAAYIEFLQAKSEADKKYAASQSLAVASAYAIQSRFAERFNKDNIRAKKKELADLKEANVKERNELEIQFAKKQVDYTEYSKRLLELQRSEVVESFSLLKEAASGFADALGDAFAPMIEKQRKVLKQSAELYASALTNQATVTEEANRALSTARADLMRAEMEGNTAAADAARAQIKANEDRLSASTRATTDVVTAAWTAAGANIVGALGTALIEGQSVFKALVMAALDALQALVPILAAQIFGVQVASPDPLNAISGGAKGIESAAVLTTLLTSLVQVAKAAAANAFFRGVVGLHDPRYPNGRDTVPAMLTQGESVMTRSVTQKNRSLLEYLNRTGGHYLDFALQDAPSRATLVQRLGLDKLGITFTGVEVGAAVAEYIHAHKSEQGQMQRQLVQVTNELRDVKGELQKMRAERPHTTTVQHQLVIDGASIERGFKEYESNFNRRF